MFSASTKGRGSGSTDIAIRRKGLLLCNSKAILPYIQCVINLLMILVPNSFVIHLSSCLIINVLTSFPIGDKPFLSLVFAFKFYVIYVVSVAVHVVDSPLIMCLPFTL